MNVIFISKAYGIVPRVNQLADQAYIHDKLFNIRVKSHAKELI